MASNSKIPLSLPLLASMAIFLILLHSANSADVTTFLFDRFDQSNENLLIIQGDASVSSNGALQLTRVDSSGVPQGGSVGRALYSDPIPLYDKSTGAVASIFTSFIFLISSPSDTPGDGLTFFLASPDTTIPPNSGGGYLGLFSASNALNNTRKELVGFKSTSDKVVAVEFDTYPNLNLGDPDYKHIGIDVNSIKSEVTAEWDFQNGELVAVTIFYNPYGKTLRVFASYPNGYNVDFTHDIDLTTVLPEQVRVGFSGATGQYSQINNIISWSFGSILGKSFRVEKGGIASVV
ncbi:lectin [Arachis duranensis]|uniref:Lectin n=1 Tax=Arachis duranensis TaxID=130453 RepID=A0A6P4BIA5_ARADU|nr:lectin [Arachis duranensis]